MVGSVAALACGVMDVGEASTRGDVSGSFLLNLALRWSFQDIILGKCGKQLLREV